MLKFVICLACAFHPGYLKSTMVTDLSQHLMQSCFYTNPHATGQKKDFAAALS